VDQAPPARAPRLRREGKNEERNERNRRPERFHRRDIFIKRRAGNETADVFRLAAQAKERGVKKIAPDAGIENKRRNRDLDEDEPGPADAPENAKRNELAPCRLSAA